MIGPNVIQAIINNTGDNWKGFPFLFSLCTAASLVIWFTVDIEKGRRAAVRWADERRGVYNAKAGQFTGKQTSISEDGSEKVKNT